MGECRSLVDVRVLHAERCLHAQHQNVSCGHCAKVCSFSAVSIVDGLPAIKPLLCRGCGLCVAACPMDVFQALDWSEEWLADKAESLQARPVSLACLDTSAASSGSLRTRACLAAYSPAVWLILGWDADVRLDVSECSSCSVKCAREVIERAAGTCNMWLGECGTSRRIVLQEGADSSRPGFARKKLLDGACGPRQSERGFLLGGSLLFGEGASGEGSSGEGHAPDYSDRRASPACRRRLDHVYVPSTQRQLQGFWATVGSEFPGGITLPALFVDAGLCQACGTCFQYCPTGAIQQAMSEGGGGAGEADADAGAGGGRSASGDTDEGASLVFSFYPGRCADCGLCVLSCRENALSRGYRPASPIASVLVASLAVKACSECGAPTPREGDDACLWCRGQKDTGSIIASAKRFCGFGEKGEGAV